MVTYAKERYSGMSLTGLQSSWYPGGRAERAEDLKKVEKLLHLAKEKQKQASLFKFFHVMRYVIVTRSS